MELEILYEDKNIIVVVKPPKVPSQPDKTGDMDILTLIVNHTGIKDIGIVHRLDRPVGGVMVFGKNKKATESLNSQIAQKTMEKTYYAVLCGKLEKEHGILKDYIIKNQKLNISSITDKNAKNAKEAVLEYFTQGYNVDEKYGDITLVKINLKTGRHHQIRVQFANAGYPLWGDNKYNPLFIKNRGWTQIGLWSGGLTFLSPETGDKLTFNKQPSNDIFKKFIV